MKTLSVVEARARLGELVDAARLKGEPVMITRYGRPAAMIVPVPGDAGAHERPQQEDGQ